MPSLIQAENIYSYQSDAAGIRTLIACAVDGTGSPSIANEVVYWDANGVAQTIFVPANKASNLRAAYSRDYMYFTDGIQSDLKKWNYTNGLSTWGDLAPVVGITLGAVSAGAVTLITGRIYFVVFLDPVSGNYSDLSPFSPITGPLTNEQQGLTGIAVSTQSTVTQKVILATADGGNTATLYYLATIPNSQTTYTDDTPELTLLENDVYQYTDVAGVTHGVQGNQPPPNGSFPTKHNGRMFMASGQLLQFSKSLSDLITPTGNIPGRYEEDWPLTNNIDISEIAEQLRGLLSVNDVLYMGTETAVHRLQGDSPVNFSEPAVLFDNTGVLTQNVWQVVFIEDTPVGAMWLTPDYRCLGSDYNTFDNVGVPVQNILNTINPNAINNCWAISTNSGAFNFFVLFLATGNAIIPNTLLVYDMRGKRWFEWTCADSFSAGIFYVSLYGIPRWIVCDANGNIRQFSINYWLDRQGDATQTGITTTLTTSWLAMGDYLTRKTLNEVEVETQDPNMTITVQGASQQEQWSGTALKTTLIKNGTLILNAFSDYKLPLAGLQAIDRMYRFTFNSTSTLQSTSNDVVLGAYSVEVVPLHRY